jgi:chromosome partitioning protein
MDPSIHGSMASTEIFCYFNHMKTIAFLTQKGGSGKTTLAVHLAVAAEEAGERVCLIDTDPQGTATAWAERREYETPYFAATTPSGLADALKAARAEGMTLAVVDTAPHAKTEAPLVISLVDFVLIPCRPTAFDLAAVSRTVQTIQAIGKPAAFVLSQCPPRALEIPEMIQALTAHNIPNAPVSIGSRLSYARAVATGRSVTEFEGEGKAAEEIRRLFNWIKEILYGY